MRKLLVAILIAVLPVASVAKDKKKNRLPDPVLAATTVMVAIDPESGESLTGDQKQARLAVERALKKWGRFSVAMYVDEINMPDLIIIEIRKGGSAVKQTIRGGPLDQRGSTIDATDMGVSVGVEGPRPSTSRPHAQTEYSTPDDMFSVYVPSGPKGRVLAWRYAGKNALDPPAVRAVEEFRKAVAESEEAKKSEEAKERKP